MLPCRYCTQKWTHGLRAVGAALMKMAGIYCNNLMVHDKADDGDPKPADVYLQGRFLALQNDKVP